MSISPLLQGVKVLDASRVLAGPYCGQLLGDLGAEVIKLERPGEGDDTRGWGPPFHGEFSAYFLSCNRNKRSLTLDLSRDEGRAILHQLLDQCDVLIENFRSDSLEKLGLTATELLEKHPRLVVGSISGYGRTGPMKDVLGYDFAIQALSGLMSITGPRDGTPFKVGVAVTDVLTGLHAAVGILAALRHRDQTGRGTSIDLSLLDCAVASQVNVAQAYLTTGNVVPRQGNAHLQIVPYQLFATSDGFLVLNVGNDRQWQHFCDAAETPSLAEDARFLTNRDRVTHRHILIPILEAKFREHPTEEWQRRLEANQVPHALVQDHHHVFENEQLQSRGMKQVVSDPEGKSVSLIGSPFQPDAPIRFPPRLGEHSREVLQELLGFDSSTLDQLETEKLI